MLSENHGGTVEAVHTQLGSGMCVHCDAADTTHIGEGQNVCDGVLIVPHGAEVRKVANHRRILKTAVGECTEGVGAGSNIGKHAIIAKNRNSGLQIQEDSVRVNAGNL